MAKKKAVPELTREQKIQKFINERYGNYKPEPTYEFKIGDSVVIGSLEDVVICDVIGDGIYEIDFTRTECNYGNPIKYPHQKRFVHWYQIRPVNNNTVSLVKNDDLSLSFSQQTIEGAIIHRANYFGIDFSPEYQRDYVWDLEDKVDLIDSIFNNIEIGKFVFIHNPYGTNDNTYTVLDGKQRTLTLLAFYENRFPYKGLYYNDLSFRDKAHFLNYRVSVSEVDEISEEQILRYFISLNTAGKTMDKSHIEKVRKMIEKN